jgi:DNA-binding transcriptional LysR family regulator
MSTDLLAGNIVSVMPEFTPTPTELWLICPSKQLITPAVRLLRDTFKKKCSTILKQLIERGILDDSVLT